MMGDERGKDKARASAMLKKHETLEAVFVDYSETVNKDLSILVRVRLRVFPIDNQCHFGGKTR